MTVHRMVFAERFRDVWRLAAVGWLWLVALESAAGQTTFTVRSIDDSDDGVCDEVHCSLREAITAANETQGEAVIAFDVPGAGPHIIQPTSQLPAILDNVTVDGTTEPDLPDVWTPVVVLDGTDAGGASGLVMAGSNSTIRGLVIRRFENHGIEVLGSDNLVAGNLIGTDPSGETAPGNGQVGVLVRGNGNTVGGITWEDWNLIGGSGLDGVRLEGGASGTVIEGNWIGTNLVDGRWLDLGNGRAGIALADGAANNVLGGCWEVGCLFERVRFNDGPGIGFDADAGVGNRVLVVSVTKNGGLGIDLGNDGPTPNDEGDGDAGPNDLLNHPSIMVVPTTAWVPGEAVEGVVLRADLNSVPESTYEIQFHASPGCDATGYGEGARTMRRATLTTDASGNGHATATAGGVRADSAWTAIATDPEGNTSEFSKCAYLSDFTIAMTPPTRSVSSGRPATYQITVTSGGAFFDEVELYCVGLPAGAACSFSDATVYPGSGSAASTLTVSTTGARSGSGGGWAGGGWMALLFSAALVGLGRLGIRGRLPWNRREEVSFEGPRGAPLGRGWQVPVKPRRPLLLMCIALVCMVLALQMACGDGGTGPGKSGMAAGTYDITVHAKWESAIRTVTGTLVVE